MGFGMRVVAFDPFVGAERYRELGVEKAETQRRGLRAGRLHHAAPAQDARDRGLAGRRGVREDASDGVRILNVARGPLIVDEDLEAGARLRQGRRRGARRLPLRADHRAPAVRLSQRHRHAAPRRLDRRGHRPRRLPGRRAGRRRAHRRRGHDRGQRAGGRRRGPRGARAVPAARARSSAGSRPSLGEGSSIDRVEVEYLGRIAERDTRPLGVAVLLGVLQRPHRGGRQRGQRARRSPQERGIEVAETASATARDFTDLAARDGRVGRRRERVVGTVLGRRNRPHLLEAWGQRFNLQLEDAPRDLPLPRRARA